jgi:hypothetical protein
MITESMIEVAAIEHVNSITGRPYISNKKSFISGAKWALQQQRWISPKDKLPGKPGISTYEHVPCLVKYKGCITILSWNCEENCWDTEDGDDYKCDPEGVDWYMPLSSIPEPPAV